jgi:excinuclease ABC subunit A
VVQLNGLVDAGNTVVVVEHDVSVAAQSDWVIEVGPGAGEEGGRVISEPWLPGHLRGHSRDVT